MAIKQTANGNYLVDYRDLNGVRCKRTFRTKREAEAFDGSIKLQKYEERLVKSGVKTARYLIEQAVDDFLLTKSDLRETTKKKYSFVIAELKKFAFALNIKFVDEFTPDHATLLYNELIREKETIRGKKKIRAKAKPKTVNFFLSSVKAFFQQEYIKDHIKRNPMLHIKNLRVERRRPEFYTREELKAFFSQPMDDAYRLAFMGLLFTGMRFAELANITWQDIGFERKLFFVRSSESFRTKTFNSERAIPMNNIMYDLLQKYHPHRLSDIFVFSSPKGFQLRERRLLDTCKSIAKDAGITSNAYLHKFRHTYATMLIHNGVKIQNIKELLGHWSVSETERYAHNKSDHLHEDVSQLDRGYSLNNC
jgi:integrase/recombinase XerD